MLMQASDALTTGGIKRPLFTCDDRLIPNQETQGSVICQKLEAVLAWDRQIISGFQTHAKMPRNKPTVAYSITRNTSEHSACDLHNTFAKHTDILELEV